MNDPNIPTSFDLSMSLSRFIQMRLTLGYDPGSSTVQEPSMTVDNNICQSHFRREAMMSMITSMLLRLHNAGTRAFWAFVRQAYGLLFLTLHSNRSEDSKP